MMAILVWLLFGFLLLRYLTSKRYKLPPGPRGLPFFGNAFQLDKNAPHETATGWSDKYGDVFRIKVCMTSMLPSCSKIMLIIPYISFDVMYHMKTFTHSTCQLSLRHHLLFFYTWFNEPISNSKYLPVSCSPSHAFKKVMGYPRQHYLIHVVPLRPIFH